MPKDLPTLSFAEASAWANWLATNHRSSKGIWIKFAKKASGIRSVTYHEAVHAALAWGWIDGQKSAHDDQWFLQRFTPRGARSSWSKINRAKAEAIIATGQMTPAGLAEVERAKADGRWHAAYDSPRNATPPKDFIDALAANVRAARFFETIDAANRYAILYRIQTAKRAATRAERIAKFVAMLARKETIHPRTTGIRRR
jgi:uncharacterized protein YdeI (YjbR/CyaY-like superfamily)